MAITNQINCPLYITGEQLVLSDRVLQLPAGKAACLILARDVTELLCQLRDTPTDTASKRLFSCSGCQGIIKFRHIETPAAPIGHTPPREIGFSGHLDILPPEELMQAINMNQKTGNLFFTFPETQASILFYNGIVIGAVHGEKKDKEAFFSILKERAGFFQFSKTHPTAAQTKNGPIADFMNLLMEGLQKMDETTKKRTGAE